MKENEFKNRLAEANKGNASLSNYAADKSLFSGEISRGKGKFSGLGSEGHKFLRTE